MEGKAVQIEQLRLSCERIFNFIQHDLGISSVQLDQNFYWELPEDVRFDMENIPTPKHVGSLVDDYAFVQLAVANSEQALPLMFKHLAPLLEMLSTKVPSYK
jgi:hypothetical protein